MAGPWSKAGAVVPSQVGTAFIDIRPELSGFQRHVSRGVDPAIRNTSRSITSGLGGAFRMVAGIAAGAFAAVGVANFIGSAIGEAREAQRIGRETEAVLKATGNAAGLSRGQIEQYADEISRLIGVDDDIIQDGENLMLTFRNVGQQAFKPATEAAVDLAAALNDGVVSTSTLQSSTILVGKALNDPIRGLTALRRVGVAFSAQQEEQIKGFMAVGDLAGAQGVILAELQGEFAGAAEAAADPAQRLTVAWEQFKEKVGTALLPVLERVANFILDRFVPGIERLIGIFQEEGIGGVVREIVDSFRNAGPAVEGGLGGILESVLNWIRESGPKIAEQIPILANKFIDWVEPYMPMIREKLMQFLSAILKWIGEVAPALGEALIKLGQKFIEWVAPLIPPLLLELLKLEGRIAYWAFFTMPFLIGEWVAAWVLKFLAWVGDLIGKLPGRLAEVTSALLHWAGEQPGKIVEKLKSLADKFIDVGKEWITKAFDGIRRKAGELAGDLGDFLGRTLSALNPFGDGWGVEAATGGFQDARVGSQKVPGGGSVIAQLAAMVRGSGVPFSISSGYRPGARTKSGNLSLHALGRAVDFVGPNMMAIFRSLLPYAGNLRELIYSPAGFSIKNGRKVPPYAVADHFDHVHAALAGGGLVKHRPGGIVANIGEGQYDELVTPLSPNVLGQMGGLTVEGDFVVTTTVPPRAWLDEMAWRQAISAGL